MKGGDDLKHGRRLTREQKIMLKDHGFNPDEWLRVKSSPENILFVHRITKTTLLLPKEG
jgi:hypothetical protein